MANRRAVRSLRRLALALLVASAADVAAARTLMRISTENAAGHVQTRMVRLFVERLSRRVGDELIIDHRFDAALFRDQDVVGALERGLVEMATPGTWQLDRFVPDVGVLMLPVFYGIEASVNHAVRDGEVGRRINQAVEDTLDVTVLGRWIDLGYAHLFSTDKPLVHLSDIRGLKIRIPGGRTNSARLDAMGATPQIIPWPDLPAALERRVVGGVLSTFESVVSARLWDNGIRHCLEDREYYPQYIPLVSKPFWRRLTPELRQAVVDAWEEIVPVARQAAAVSQDEARARLIERKITITPAKADDLARMRAALVARQEELAAALGIDRGLAALAEREIERAGKPGSAASQE